MRMTHRCAFKHNMQNSISIQLFTIYVYTLVDSSIDNVQVDAIFLYRPINQCIVLKYIIHFKYQSPVDNEYNAD